MGCSIETSSDDDGLSGVGVELVLNAGDGWMSGGATTVCVEEGFENSLKDSDFMKSLKIGVPNSTLQR